jgi:hypothetical protein
MEKKSRAIVMHVGRVREMLFELRWFTKGLSQQIGPIIRCVELLGNLERDAVCDVRGFQIQDEENRFRFIVRFSDDKNVDFDKLAGQLAYEFDEAYERFVKENESS